MPLSSRVLEFCPCTESRSGTSQQRIEWFWSALLGAARPASPDLQQLEAMARDRAAVRQSVEQLAAGQEQMTRDIARVQPAEQDIRHKISVALPATSRCPGAQARADATTGTTCAADFSAAARAAAAIPVVAQAVVGGRSCASG